MTKEVASPQKAESSQTSARRGQVEIVGFALFGAFEKFVATRGHRLRVGRRKLLVRRGAGGADRGHWGRLIGHGFQILALAAGAERHEQRGARQGGGDRTAVSHLNPPARRGPRRGLPLRSEEQTSELQSLMRNSYAVF